MSSIAYWKNEWDKAADIGEVTDTEFSDDFGYDNNETNFTFNSDNIVNWVSSERNIPFGQKVIRLQPLKNGLVKVLFWQKDKYIFSKIEDKYLSNTPVISEINIKSNLINELSHLIYRNSNDINKYAEFDKLFNDIKSQKNIIESYNEAQIIDWLNKLKTIVVEENKVETLDKITSIVFNTYNPLNDSNIDYKSETLFIPISEQFFALNSELQNYYQKYWMNDGNLNRLQGNSGEGVTNKTDIDFIFTKLKDLQKFLEEKNLLLNSPEYDWLTYANNIDFTKIDRLIFISRSTWDMNKYSRYADYIAILNTICWYGFVPLISVLIHEMNVNSYKTNFFPQGDTHKSKENAEIIWQKILKIKNINQLNLTQDDTDLLYQNSRNIDLLLYSIAFNY
jgi:hypothetical protein